MPHIWLNQKVAVQEFELIPLFWNKLSSLQKELQRYKEKPFGIKRLQLGGRGRKLLIDFDTLPKNIQESLGDPRKVNHPLESFFKFDPDAVRFYSKFKRNGSHLLSDEQEKYIINASVLNAVILLEEARTQERIKMNHSLRGIPDTLLADIITFQNSLKVIYQKEHTLPTSLRFKNLLKEYKTESYYCIIKDPEGIKAQNARKVDDSLEMLLNALFKNQVHKPTPTEVSRNYEAFINGYAQVFNEDTGELYNPKQYKSLSQSTIISYISYLAPFLKWLFRIASIAFLLLFLFALANGIWRGSNRGHRVAYVQDERESVTQVIPNPRPVVNTETNRNPDDKEDEIIKRFRKWEDYSGHEYEGYYEVKKSAFDQSHQFKNQIQFSPGSLNGYDEMVFKLKENDMNSLDGVYHMLDSIQVANSLAPKDFAEMTVSMVPDIPYSLVLENDCNAALYRDRFIQDWLAKPDGYCDPFQRFGINSPVEFITNLKGDCDTRTLLLYTLLSHYNFDVVLLSSEIYKHSLLGINLPVQGVAYSYRGDRFVVWETTATQVPPGILNPELANMKYWRISLKSKNK